MSKRKYASKRKYVSKVVTSPPKEDSSVTKFKAKALATTWITISDYIQIVIDVDAIVKLEITGIDKYMHIIFEISPGVNIRCSLNRELHNEYFEQIK